MIQGIAIVGLNGAGKSTLAHALAGEIDYYEMDVEDYYFPEQKASRREVLEGKDNIHTTHLGDLPFSVANSKEAVQRLLLEDINKHPHFIISGVTMNWSKDILSRIGIAFFIKTPAEKRVERIEEREVRRFGDRVLEGGDMYRQQVKFREIAAMKDIKDVEDCIAKLSCPIIELDGMKSVEENLEIVKAHLNQHLRSVEVSS